MLHMLPVPADCLFLPYPSFLLILKRGQTQSPFTSFVVILSQRPIFLLLSFFQCCFLLIISICLTMQALDLSSLKLDADIIFNRYIKYRNLYRYFCIKNRFYIILCSASTATVTYILYLSTATARYLCRFEIEQH